MSALRNLAEAIQHLARARVHLLRVVPDLTRCPFCDQWFRAEEMHRGACNSPSCQEEAMDQEIGDRRYQEWKDREER